MSTPLKFIRPRNLNESRILSWFSKKNAHHSVENARIQGLNVGFNSDENQDIILEQLHVLAKETDTSLKHIAIAQQIHSNHVKVVTKGGIYPDTDAFVSSTLGISLLIQVADCGAVLLGDATNQVIGAAHAGWRGAQKGIVRKTVESMLEIGAEISSIEAYISPCISVDAFEVGQEVANLFPEQFVEKNKNTKPYVDLKGYIFGQLVSIGILNSHIVMDTGCTFNDQSDFYSYRREANKAGRMAAVIKLNEIG